LAASTGIGAVIVGLSGAVVLDLPAGPAVVVAALGLFVVSAAAAAFRPKPSV